MSHVVSIKTQLLDLNAIEAATKACGCELVRGQTTYKWWGSSMGDYPLPQGFKAEDLGKCDHAIKVPGTTWEVGVARARNADGSLAPGYTLLCDFFGSQGLPIAKALGGTFSNPGTGAERANSMTFNRFLQEYGVAKATAEAKRMGYTVQRQTTANGAVKLVMSSY